MPDRPTLLFHACEMDSPTGKSNSSRQSLIGTVLRLVMVKRAMKPVCHVEVTDNVAVAAAACATAVVANPRATTIAADTATRSAVRQRFTQL